MIKCKRNEHENTQNIVISITGVKAYKKISWRCYSVIRQVTVSVVVALITVRALAECIFLFLQM